jgi:hypothetical protein
MTTLSNVLPQASPRMLIEPAAHPRSRDICKVAIQSLKELAIALAAVAVCIPFAANSAAIGLLIGCSAAGVVLNTGIRYLQQRLTDEKLDAELTRYARSMIFSLGSSIHTTTLIHESGHFLGAKLLLQGTPKIQINPYATSYTSFSTGALTSLGTRLGTSSSILALTIAGPALAVLAGTIAIVAGMILRKSHPDVAAYMAGTGALNIVTHVQYACSALPSSATTQSNDFVRMKSYGIHPLAACGVMIALPVISTLGVVLAERIFHHKNPNADLPILPVTV